MVGRGAGGGGQRLDTGSSVGRSVSMGWAFEAVGWMPACGELYRAGRNGTLDAVCGPLGLQVSGGRIVTARMGICEYVMEVYWGGGGVRPAGSGTLLAVYGTRDK